MKESPMRVRTFSLITAAMLMVAPLAAQDIAATWQGTFNLDSDARRMVLQIAKNSQGGWEIPEFHVEFVHDDLHVDSVALNGLNLKFSVAGSKGEYIGKVSSDGASIQGTWTFDHHAMPLELRRTTKDAAWQGPFQYQYHLKTVTYGRPSPAETKIPFDPQLAVDYMEQGALAWTSDWKCVACHTNGSYMVVRPLLTPQLGQPQKQLRDFFVATLREEQATDPVDLRPELDSTGAVYVAAGLAIWDANVTHQLSPETAEALDMMFRLQRADGTWTISDDNNPPLESKGFQLATVAARAVGNAPGWLEQQRGKPIEAKIQLLEKLLRSESNLQGDYDRTDLLWAATELPGLLSDERKAELIQMIMKHQRLDGGWSIRTFAKPEEWGKGNRAEKLRAELELADPASDGHMTGLAIIAMRKAGVPANDPRIQRGVLWLLANQRSSGRWYTRSLNRDGWQFITYSGTAYPLLALALCDALPGRSSIASAAGK